MAQKTNPFAANGESMSHSSPTAKKRPSLEEIKSTLRRIMPEIKERYKVKSLGVFGSYVRGEASQTSDLDLLVEFELAPTLYELIRMEHYLSDQVGIKVDLVMKKTLRPYLGKRILEEVVAV
jgi:predicted nucleotidyltransferase